MHVQRHSHRPQGTGAGNHAQSAADRQRRLRRHGGRTDQPPARRRRDLRDRGAARRRRGFLRRPRDHGQTPPWRAAGSARTAPPQRRGVQLLRRVPPLRNPGDRRGSRARLRLRLRHCRGLRHHARRQHRQVSGAGDGAQHHADHGHVGAGGSRAAQGDDLSRLVDRGDHSSARARGRHCQRSRSRGGARRSGRGAVQADHGRAAAGPRRLQGLRARRSGYGCGGCGRVRAQHPRGVKPGHDEWKAAGLPKELLTASPRR